VAVQRAEGSTPSADAVRGIVREELKANPKLIVETISSYVREEQDRQARDLDKQAVSQKSAIADFAGWPVLGNTEGAVTLVYFFDANCAYCKETEPVLKQVVAENPDVRIVHREIPILSETSMLAAHVGNMVWEIHPARYQEFHDKLLARSGMLSAEDIEDYLTLVLGSDDAQSLLARAKVLNDLASIQAKDRITKNHQVAKAAGISGTPFIYVLEGDGLLRGAGEDAHEQLTALIGKGRGEKK
jgi:protein-disulfide isomerase